MPINQMTGTVRGQNISVLEGARGRTLQEQLADQQEALARSQMAQQAAQFKAEQDWRREQQRKAEEQAELDRWYGIGGSLAGGALTGGLGLAGNLLGKK
jgi:hypothetical protein